MTQIGFYHCTRTAPDTALPRLLGRTLETGERALVLCGGAERVTAIDAALWACKDPVWLPHGTQATGDADLQPIWIAELPDPANGARFLFVLDNAETGALDAWTRVFFLFDGNDEGSVGKARASWRAAREAGHALTYWQQGEGGWEKKA